MAIYTPDLLVKTGLDPDNLWEAAGKINENLAAISTGIDQAVDRAAYQNPVATQGLNAAPTTGLELGARYIVAFGVLATDPWYGHVDDIAELVEDSPYTWEFVIPENGYCCLVIDENLEYIYTGSDWVSRPSATLHNALASKQGGNAEDDEYYHLTQDEVGYLPTTDEKDALAGTGTPAADNVFVTEDALDIDSGHDHDGENSKQAAWGSLDFTTSDIADLTTKSHTSLSDIGDITHDDIDSYLPSSDEKDALAGSTGTPGSDNVFVTETDTRLADARKPTAHAASHIKGTDLDTIDGDKIDISWDAANYTPSTCTEADHVDHLTAHLKGVDNAIGNKSASNHTHTDLPTSDQKAALAGTGTPAAANVFVTKDTLVAAVYGTGEFKDSVIDKDVATPPVSPTEGDAYIVADDATGSWVGHENDIAKWNGTVWVFVTPVEGMNSVYVQDEDWIYLFDGSVWFAVNAPVPGPQGPQGPQGVQGEASTVAGPQGVQGEASTVAGPQGPQGTSGSATTITGTAGATLAQYDVVYADSADSGKFKKAINNITATVANAVGIVTQEGGIANGATGIIQIGQGFITTGSWTAGGDIFVGATAGTLTQTQPVSGYAKPMGFAISSTQIFFNPQLGWSATVT